MAKNTWIILGLLVTALSVGACGGGGASTTADSSSTGESPPMPTPCSPASAAGGPYCLTFTGTQYAATHAGQKFEVSIVDATTGLIALDPLAPHAALTQIIAALPTNGFFLNFSHALVAGGKYYVDYYADENHSQHCDAPATDHVWRSHHYTDFFHGIVTTITEPNPTSDPSLLSADPGVSGDVVWATQHDDPFLTDGNAPSVSHPDGMNTCAQLP